MGVHGWLLRPRSAGAGWYQPAARQSPPGCARVQPDRPGVHAAGHAGNPEPVVARHACGSAVVRVVKVYRSMVYIGGPGPGAGESGAVWAPEARLGATVYPPPGCDGPPDVWLGPVWS